MKDPSVHRKAPVDLLHCKRIVTKAVIKVQEGGDKLSRSRLQPLLLVMSRLTASDLRHAITEPTWRPAPVKGKGGPSTHSSMLAAVRTYHSLHGGGPDAARAALEASLSGSEYWKAGSGATMRGNALACLDTYIDLAESDRRLASNGTKVAYAIGENEISVEVPVILRDGVDIEVRLYIDGPLASPLTEEQRLMYAAPAILACVEEFETTGTLFSDRVIGAQVWELRGGAVGRVSRAAAMSAVSLLEDMFTRLSS